MARMLTAGKEKEKKEEEDEKEEEEIEKRCQDFNKEFIQPR